MSADGLEIKCRSYSWLVSVLLAVISMSPIGIPILSNIDYSYAFALNYFFAHGIQMGKDILFTYGPLAFILGPQPIGNNLEWALAIVLSLKLLFVFLCFILYASGRKLDIKSCIYGILIVYVLARIIDTEGMLEFIPLLAVIVYILEGNMLWVVIGSAIVGVALLVKSSIGIISLLFIVSFSAYCLWSRRERKIPLISLSIITLTFLIVWFCLYHNFLGVVDYFRAIVEFSMGNSSAMTLNPDNNWLLFSCFVILFLLYPFMRRDRKIFLVYGLSALSLIVAFKYAMSREDHAHFFGYFLLIFLFMVILAARDFKFRDFILLGLTVALFFSFIYVDPYKGVVRKYVRYYASKPLSINFIGAFCVERTKRKLKETSEASLKPFMLDSRVIHLIGNASVDTYPWNTIYIAANKLNWKPRPVFQSYIAFTHYLDKKNADFLSSRNAPRFIIWHRTGMMSIDNRYLLNDNPLTLYEILDNYKLVSDEGSFVVLKRIRPKLSARILLEEECKWGQWITVPDVSKDSFHSYLIAKIFIDRTFLQKFKKLIYKEFEVYVCYKFIDGREETYRIVIDNVRDGLWVSPFLKRLFDVDSHDRVIAIKFTRDRYDLFRDTIKVRWVLITSKEPLFEVKKRKILD